jgi:hypothetical protein
MLVHCVANQLRPAVATIGRVISSNGHIDSVYQTQQYVMTPLIVLAVTSFGFERA